MTIPKIAPYELPARSVIEKERAPWQLNAARSALLVHDLQDYFVDFYDRSVDPVASMLRHSASIVARARELGVPVFYTAQPPEQSAADRGLLNDMWGPGITKRPEAATIVSELAPEESDILLVKHRYSAFQRSDFEEQLRARGRDQLVIVGVYAHIGCQLTASEAFMRDIQPFMVADALADFSQEHHTQALQYVSGCCGRVVTTDELLAAWQANQVAV